MQLLLAELTSKPDTRAELAAALDTLARFARDEAGSLLYAVHRVQDADDCIIVYELYRDAAARASHLELPRVRDTLARFEALLAAPPRLLFAETLSFTQAIGALS